MKKNIDNKKFKIVLANFIIYLILAVSLLFISFSWIPALGKEMIAAGINSTAANSYIYDLQLASFPFIILFIIIAIFHAKIYASYKMSENLILLSILLVPFLIFVESSIGIFIFLPITFEYNLFEFFWVLLGIAMSLDFYIIK